MGAESKIQWTHHSFNPWWGCQRVSPGCQRCYAETFDKRVGGKHWGPTAPRRTFGPKHWVEPLKWAKAAAKAGERHRVFCASMADVFEDRPELAAEREKLWALIRRTAFCTEDGTSFTPAPGENWAVLGGLDWLLLTKRPENVLRMAPADILPLVWVGTTVEDQERAEVRLWDLLQLPARKRFLSCEPLLGPVDLSDWMTSFAGIDWVIVGGESGPGARPFDLAWARTIRDQCASAGVACFVKQLGAVVRETVPSGMGAMGPHLMERKLVDRKGGDPSEWPEDLRVRQFPEVRQ